MELVAMDLAGQCLNVRPTSAIQHLVKYAAWVVQAHALDMAAPQVNQAVVVSIPSFMAISEQTVLYQASHPYLKVFPSFALSPSRFQHLSQHLVLGGTQGSELQLRQVPRTCAPEKSCSNKYG